MPHLPGSEKFTFFCYRIPLLIQLPLRLPLAIIVIAFFSIKSYELTVMQTE